MTKKITVTTILIMTTILTSLLIPLLSLIPLLLLIVYLMLEYKDYKTLSNLELNPSQVIRHADINDIKITDCEIRSIGGEQ